MAKPTPIDKEKIKKETDDIINELDNPAPSASAPSPSQSQPSPSQPAPSPSPSQSQPSPSQPAPSPSPSQSWQDRYRSSTTESLVHRSAREALSTAIDKAKNIPMPTDEEIQQAFPEWDVMDDVTRKMAIDNYINNKRFELIAEANEEGRDLDKWIKTVEEYLEDPATTKKYPGLEGKEEKFRAFAMTKTRRGVPLEDLVAAFLYSSGNTKKTSSKSQQLPTSSGPGTKRPDEEKYDPQVAANLKRENWPSYLKYIKKHRKEIEKGEGIA